MPDWLRTAIDGDKFEPIINEPNRWGEQMRIKSSGRVVKPGDVVTPDEIA